jgi:hypothetical protein
VEEASMKKLASKTWSSVAVAAAAMSVVCYFVPYGYPWPSLAWGVLACGAVWAGMSSIRAIPPLSDVINNVEAESPRSVTRAHDSVSRKAVS